ncbi:hypothetical protein ACFUKV_07715 [Streptomyces paradoxus]|uniref:hypothetical protein n=1 Tax=Streptomyces paradoxus TaxID=66375 RepID=UPI0036397705
MKTIGIGITGHLKSPHLKSPGMNPEDPGSLVVSDAAGDGERLIEDAPSRNDVFTALAGPVGSAGPVVRRARQSALSRSLLEPFASSRS